MIKSKLSSYQCKRLRFWTSDDNGDTRRIGTLSPKKDGLRLDWAEDLPRGAGATYFAVLPPSIVSVFEIAPNESGADFDFIDVLAVRQPAS